MIGVGLWVIPELLYAFSALRAMSGVDIENCIVDVADIAFADPRVEARNAARMALQSVINT